MPSKFSRKYFHVALAISTYYLVIKEKHLYSQKNFHGTPETVKNVKFSPAYSFPFYDMFHYLIE